MTSENNSNNNPLGRAIASRLSSIMPSDGWQSSVIAAMAKRRRRRRIFRGTILASSAAAAVAAIVFIPAFISRANNSPEEYIYSDKYYSSLPQRDIDISGEIDSIFRVLDEKN